MRGPRGDACLVYFTAYLFYTDIDTSYAVSIRYNFMFFFQSTRVFYQVSQETYDISQNSNNVKQSLRKMAVIDIKTEDRQTVHE